MNRATVTGIGALCLALQAWTVMAGDIGITRADARVQHGLYVIDADLAVRFSADTLEALDAGVALVIEVDCVITRDRSYLWDPRVVWVQHRYRLEHHALSDTFILSDLVTGDHQAFDDRDGAIYALGQLRQLPIADGEQVEQLAADGASLRFGIRARLDIEALPAPLRPIAYVSPAWRMSSGWFRWPLER